MLKYRYICCALLQRVFHSVFDPHIQFYTNRRIKNVFKIKWPKTQFFFSNKYTILFYFCVANALFLLGFLFLNIEACTSIFSNWLHYKWNILVSVRLLHYRKEAYFRNVLNENLRWLQIFQYLFWLHSPKSWVMDCQSITLDKWNKRIF